MRIAIVGYGKMGKRIETLAVENGHAIIYRVHSGNVDQIKDMKGIDVAIEFSHPEAALENFEKLAILGVPVVTGTTGWYKDFETVKALVEKHQIPFFYATNFSIGVQLALAASNYLAGLMKDFSGYTGLLEEWHHTAKKDAPSGTAITIAEGIVAHHSAYKNFALDADTDSSDSSEILNIKAYRENEIPGTHKVTYTSDVDSISLEHTAKNRDGFVLGALHASEFIIRQKPGMFTMKDLLKLPI